MAAFLRTAAASQGLVHGKVHPDGDEAEEGSDGEGNDGGGHTHTFVHTVVDDTEDVTHAKAITIAEWLRKLQV